MIFERSMAYANAMLRFFSCAVVVSGLFALTEHTAGATPRWVDRGITMRSTLGGTLDAGFGFGHRDQYGISRDAVGGSFEAVLGIQRFLDVGLRLGVRTHDLGNRSFAQGDFYGRDRDRETYRLLGNRSFANPELRLRGKVLEKGPFELALEGRILFPVNNGTGVVFGVPMALHLGHTVRLDTGLYLPIGFADDETNVGFSVPLRLWFQATDNLWLGPMSGLRVSSVRGEAVDVPLGFGLGVSVHRYVDIKGDFFFNRVNEGAQQLGFGIGVGLYFE